MKNVFINRQGKMSLTQKPDSVMIGEINRMQGTGSFENEIEVAEYNGMKAQEMSREWAYKCQQSPYTKNSTTIVFVENIVAI